jgi:1-pyrroline-5-carboxylate dehydrogenase
MSAIPAHRRLPNNETMAHYHDGSSAQRELAAHLHMQRQTKADVPLLIGGEEIRRPSRSKVRAPHDHRRVLGHVSMAEAADVGAAVTAALLARDRWAALDQEVRSVVFLKAAELLTTTHRARVVAATMLGQSKTLQQAELDICELADFWRFNVHFARRLHMEQPVSPETASYNRATWRPLEGFVLAVTPFNFTAIGGNLPTAPALLGNVVVWKPATSAVLAAWVVMDVLREAGLPAGVINFLPGAGPVVGNAAIDHPDLAGIHFTGSTQTFNALWKRVGNNLANGRYRSYPRIVGETGGKDFVVAAPDADPDAVATALFAGAFEYQGQKCSAASRAYLPRSLWPAVFHRLKADINRAHVGDTTRTETFMGALIDKRAFDRVVSYVELARNAETTEIVIGGEYSAMKGYFVNPTVVVTTDPHARLMTEEIFGPVLTVFLYDDGKLNEVLGVIDQTSPYALTGAVFARDRHTIDQMVNRLRNAAGNLYINDKPTGAVVGQQPFGGARASGTNDKAGSILNLTRWVSMQVVKENFNPPRHYAF